MEDFERSMKEQMEHVSLTDLVPGFDNDTVWKAIDQKLRPRRRVLVLSVWSHVAAVLLGLLAGWFLLRKNNVHPDTQNMTTTASHPSPTAPAAGAPAISHATPANTQDARLPAACQHKVLSGSISEHNKVRVYDTAAVAKVSLADHNPEAVLPVSVTVKHRQRAVSVLDIDNEDRQRIVRDRPGSWQPPGIIDEIQAQLVNTEGFASSDKQYVLRALLTQK
jgi:hypothetical protein